LDTLVGRSKTVFGLTNVYSGNIILEGKDVTKIRPHQAARIGIAYLPQTDNVFSELTVEENLKMAAYTLKKELLKKELRKS